MRLPRDLSGAALAARLERLGYAVTRQTGSHLRLTCADPPQHHVTIPKHDCLRIGTLAAILDSVGTRHGLGREALLEKLLG